MTGKIYSFLKEQNIAAPTLVDRLIVSAFLDFNVLSPASDSLIGNFVINIDDELFEVFSKFQTILNEDLDIFSFEDLIELFEFVVSPSDKVTNGAVYTPRHIRDFIIDEALKKQNKNLSDLIVTDIACGCGGFLLSMASKIHKQTGKAYSEIFRENIYGLDITEYSINRSKLLLSLFALHEGESNNFTFNLVVGDALSFNWPAVFPAVEKNAGFDLIIGNPPYVSSRNMEDATLTIINNWRVCQSGHPDLYIPFFQIGFELLNLEGVLGFITVNTFFKSINGRALRQYFGEEHVNLEIVNFGGEQLFKDRNTYTCICFLSRGGDSVKYIRTSSENLARLELNTLRVFLYNDLNHLDGWNLVNTQELVDFVLRVESTGKKFKTQYTTRNGIATLKNSVYKFTPVRKDNKYFYFEQTGQNYKIEKAICRPVINANKVKQESDLADLVEQIIYPYILEDGKLKIIEEETLKRKYPSTYGYLGIHKKLLAKRDKGKKQYEKWYAYGRRQSMDITGYKMFFPHICERPTFVISAQHDLLFYNGIAVVSDNLESLKVLKKILESDIFFNYIRHTTKDYASGYISMGKNYLKNFGIPEFNDDQKVQLLEAEDVNFLLEEIYGLAETVE